MRDDDGYEYHLKEGTPVRLRRSLGFTAMYQGNVPTVRDKEPDREEIERQTQEFLSRGGQIRVIETGLSNVDKATGITKNKLEELKRNWENAHRGNKRRNHQEDDDYE